jgi:hypothetical protein
VPGASWGPREVAEAPSDCLGVPSGVPRSPRGPGQKYKTHFCCGAFVSSRAWGPDSFSARWFGCRLIVVQHSRAGDHSRLSLLIWPPSRRSKATQARKYMRSLICFAVGSSVSGGETIFVFYIFELASLRGGGRARGFKLAVIRCRPFVGKEAWAHAFSCFR